MRPVYEKESDLDAQSYIAESFSSRYGIRLEKTPKMYCVDYMGYREGAKPISVEVKHRDVSIRQYPDIILSMMKVAHGRQLASITGGKFIFVVGFNDAMAWADLTDCELKVRSGGRTDRGDSQDIEPCVCIPMNMFMVFKS